jgi:hypothetical protein
MPDNSVIARVLRIEVEPAAEGNAFASQAEHLEESTTAPGSVAAELDAERWLQVMQDACSEGYNSVSIVARGAAELEVSKVLHASRQVGLTTSVSVSPDAIERLAPADAELVDCWVLRLNGPGERAASTARMTAMLSALRVLSRVRAKVSLAFHLDQSNLDDLPWAAWLAAEQAVSTLTVETAQVHSSTAPRCVQSQLDVSQRVWAMLVLARACQRYPEVRYEIDLSDVNLVRREPERLLAAPRALDVNRPLAELVSPLVIDSTGKVNPLLATLSPKLALGNVSRSWKLNTAAAFQRFCRQVHADVCENTALPFFNWAEYLHLQSRRIDAIVPRMSATSTPRPLLHKPNLGQTNGSGTATRPSLDATGWATLRPSASRLPELPWGPPRSARMSGVPAREAQRAAVVSRA